MNENMECRSEIVGALHIQWNMYQNMKKKEYKIGYVTECTWWLSYLALGVIDTCKA